MGGKRKSDVSYCVSSAKNSETCEDDTFGIRKVDVVAAVDLGHGAVTDGRLAEPNQILRERRAVGRPHRQNRAPDLAQDVSTWSS